MIDFLYGSSVWQMGIVVSLIVVGGTLIALYTIDRIWNKELRRAHNDIAGFLVAVVGIIYAILVSSLAITVMTRQDRAEAIVVQEAETVSALARETSVIEAKSDSPMQVAVRDYLNAVIDHEWDEMRLARRPTSGNEPLIRLRHAVDMLPVDNLQQMLLVQSVRSHLSKLSELRRERSEIATTGVDRIVWTVVLLGAASTIAFAVLFGVKQFAAHVLMTCLFAFTIALAMIMIIAIDWPFFGDDTIGPGPLKEVRLTMNE